MKKQLKVGFKYCNRFNAEREIVKKENNMFFDTDGVLYNPYGVALEKGASWDLTTYADGFPKLVMKLLVPVKHIHNTGNASGDYKTEYKEVIVQYIEKIPRGATRYENSKQFIYKAHYEVPNKNRFDLHPKSEIDKKLYSVFIDRKETKFFPKDFQFNDGIGFLSDSRYSKIGTVEHISWNKY